jgi:predicted outer membrane repeat protein
MRSRQPISSRPGARHAAQRRGALALLAATSALAGAVHADIIHVPRDQPTIGAAIAVAVSGDVIELAPGCYTEAFSIDDDSVTIRGSGPRQSVVLAAPPDSVVLVTGSASPDRLVELQSLTIEGDWVLSLGGGAMLLRDLLVRADDTGVSPAFEIVLSYGMLHGDGSIEVAQCDFFDLGTRFDGRPIVATGGHSDLGTWLHDCRFRRGDRTVVRDHGEVVTIDRCEFDDLAPQGSDLGVVMCPNWETLWLSDSTFHHLRRGSWLWLRAWAHVRDCSFWSNPAEPSVSGAIPIISFGHCEMWTIDAWDNGATDAPAAFALFGGSFDLNDLTVTDGRLMERGAGALRIEGAGHVWGAFERNRTRGRGGAIQVAHESATSFSVGGTFTENAAGLDGGAIAWQGSEAAVESPLRTGASFFRNVAGRDGGAIAASRVECLGGMFTGNRAGGDGGAVRATQLAAEWLVADDNHAERGGAIALIDQSSEEPTSFVELQARRNSARRAGSVLFADGGTRSSPAPAIVLDRVIIVENEACPGSAACVCDAVVTDSVVCDNAGPNEQGEWLVDAATWLGCDVLSVPSEWPTIQQAIDAARAGDMVLVEPGRYAERSRIHRKAIRLQAWALAATLDGTHAPGMGSMIEIVGDGPDADLTTILSGFTVINGRGGSPYTLGHGESGHGGGGLHIRNARVHLSLFTVEHCSAPNGGGIFVLGSDFHPDKCLVSDCSADFLGGGLCVISSTCLNTVAGYHNHADGDGGGAALIDSTILGRVPSAHECTAGGTGGGLLVSNSVVDGMSLTSFRSSAPHAAGVAILNGSDVSVVDAFVYGSEGTTSGGILIDATSSLTLTSAWVCENRPTNITGNWIDLFNNSICCECDLDYDGFVGASDVAIILGAWGAVGGGYLMLEDVDGDGLVGASDIAFTFERWGACAP